MADPLQLNLKIAIFLSFVREKKNAFYSEKWQLSVCVLFLMDYGTKTFFDMLGNLENCKKWMSSLKKKRF